MGQQYALGDATRDGSISAVSGPSPRRREAHLRTAYAALREAIALVGAGYL